MPTANSIENKRNKLFYKMFLKECEKFGIPSHKATLRRLIEAAEDRARIEIVEALQKDRPNGGHLADGYLDRKVG